jgi:hypothetical protein
MFYHPPVVRYLEAIKYPQNGKPYSARYIGSMVADVHRTLLYGGIFAYPDDKKSKSGKLRLLYEAFPMAYLTEQVSLVYLTGLPIHADLHHRPAASLQPGQSAFSTLSRPTSTSARPSSSAAKRMSTI